MQPQPTDNRSLAELGRLIKRERTRIGLNISQLALAADVSRTWLSFLERANHQTHGRPMRPSYTEVRKLAKPLGLAADRLSALAGYDEGHRDDLDPSYFTLGASTAKDSRSKPSLLRDLEDLEAPGDISSDLLERLATELPVFTFLFHLSGNPEMRLIGVSSVIGSETSAKLYTLNGSNTSLNSIHRIGTYGWHTVSTVALIVFLMREKRSWKLIGMEDNNIIASKIFPGANHTIEIEVAYATGALTHGLRKKHFDAIALPSLPYVSDRPEFRRLRVMEDLVLAGVSDYPQTVVVTHRSRLETESARHLLSQELDEISYYNEKARDEYRDERPDLVSRLGLGIGTAIDESNEQPPLLPSGLLSEVAIYGDDQVGDIADKLMGLYEIAQTITLFGDEFAPINRQWIVDSATPIYKLFERDSKPE